jgi:acetyl-CoA C-acetyltransferase
MFAHDMLLAGTHEIMVAGGMESMTNAPYLLLKGRGGYRMGHDKVYDHMMLDGLEDAYEPGRSMGTFGEDCAAKYKFTREAQDAFATASVQARQQATESGAFAAEITPVTVKDRAGERVSQHRRGPGQGQAGQDPAAQARLQEGRHHHRRLQLLHQRRRRRAGDDDREHGQRLA